MPYINKMRARPLPVERDGRIAGISLDYDFTVSQRNVHAKPLHQEDGMDYGNYRFCIAFHFRDELPAHHRG